MAQASPHIMQTTGKERASGLRAGYGKARTRTCALTPVSRPVLCGQVEASFWSSPGKNSEGLGSFLLSGGPGLWNEASLLTLSLEWACQGLGRPQTAASCTPGFRPRSLLRSLFSLKYVALLG